MKKSVRRALEEKLFEFSAAGEKNIENVQPELVYLLELFIAQAEVQQHQAQGGAACWRHLSQLIFDAVAWRLALLSAIVWWWVGVGWV